MKVLQIDFFFDSLARPVFAYTSILSMTESPRTDSATLAVNANQPKSKCVVWCSGALAAVALSAAIAVNLPDRVKLLGLFPLVWAGLLGVVLHWWADETRVSIHGWPTLLSGLLIAAGEVGIVLGGWSLYGAELQREFEKVPSFETVLTTQRKTDSQAKMKVKSSEPDARERLEREYDAKIQERRAVLMQLTTYLSRRLQKLGDFASPYPEIFWACEILLGTAVGVWCFQRVSLSRSTAP
jgi:hypothetical protein